MIYRQFMWGLSQGVGILGAAGTFWLAMGVLRGRAEDLRWATWALMALIAVGLVTILRGSMAIRRRATGFNSRELRRLGNRGERLGIYLGFLAVNIAQFVIVVLLVRWCVRTGRIELIWPMIGLVVGLHFIPMARLFRVQPYAAMGVAMTAASLLAMMCEGGLRFLVLGVGVGMSCWLTAFYLIRNADQIAQRACGLPSGHLADSSQ